MLAEGKPLERLNEGESVHAKRGTEGGVLAEAPAAREAVAGALTSGAGEDALVDKKPDTLSFAGRLEGRSAESGGIQRQYASALVPGADVADGRTRVLTFAFADASSRSKAIEWLRRELLQGEGIEEAKPSAGFPRATQRSVRTPQETHPAEMAYQPSAGAGDSVRHGRQEMVLRSLRESEVNGILKEAGDASLDFKVASIDTNPDSAVNVLKVVAVDGASADRLVAALTNGDWSASGYRLHLNEAEADRRGEHKAKEAGPRPSRPSMKPDTDVPRGVAVDDDGDYMSGGVHLSKPPATQPSRESLYRSDADTITPLDRLMTWDVPLVLENGGRDDIMTDEQGVANQVYDMALRPDRSIVLDADAAPHAATLPADSPQAKASYGMGGMGMMGSAVAGTGLSGMGAGYGGFAATKSEGSTSKYAGSAFVRSDHSAMSAVESRPADSNLLVVYFVVLSPDRQPAGPAASSAPASADQTSQPAVHP